MATSQLATSSFLSTKTFNGLRPSIGFSNLSVSVCSSPKSFKRAVVLNATTVAASKYTSIKPLGDRVLIKTKILDEKSVGGILLPSSVKTKPQSGEVIAVGPGKKVGTDRLPLSLKTGSGVVYSKYAGTEIEVDGLSHLILKEDDVIGILDTEDVKDLKPLNDRILIKVAEAEEKTAGGLFLSQAAKEKPSIGTVVAVGPGLLIEEGERSPLPVSAGNTVLFSKYAGTDLKSEDGSDYIALRVSEADESVEKIEF
ncbi:hypothetical protein V2J09_019154 [Rumex salicifolius]